MISYGRLSRRKLQSPRALPLRILAAFARLIVYLVILSVVLVFLLRFFNPPTSAFILASRFESKAPPLQQYWRPIEAMGLNIRIAVLAAEDQRFWSHWGFDVIEIEDALDDLLDGRGRRGASSITQQTAKNLFLWKGHSFIRKGIEAYFTLLLEALLPKRRILELYLNLAEFGPGLYGAEAASRVYFGKHSSQLSLREAALLAAVLPNPKKRTPTNLGPKVMQRVEWIEDQAIRTGNVLARER